ncbi:MAG: hypothetical protein JWN44_5782 [Myxococcales bacterium]|nr:hypothetical protein [Myxococcales bacterium]
MVAAGGSRAHWSATRLGARYDASPVRVIFFLVFAVTVSAAAGCGVDCGGQSIPHCPFPGGAECINGGWYCVGLDLSGEAAPDLSLPRDQTSASD